GEVARRTVRQRAARGGDVEVGFAGTALEAAERQRRARRNPVRVGDVDGQLTAVRVRIEFGLSAADRRRGRRRAGGRVGGVRRRRRAGRGRGLFGRRGRGAGRNAPTGSRY